MRFKDAVGIPRKKKSEFLRNVKVDSLKEGLSAGRCEEEAPGGSSCSLRGCAFEGAGAGEFEEGCSDSRIKTCGRDFAGLI